MAPALELDGVAVRTADGAVLLEPIDLIVDEGQRWVLLGPNGSGKTTLLRVASMYLHPSSGSVRVLGELLGRTDVRALRARIGLSSASLSDQLRPTLLAGEVVMTAKHGALEPWWHHYDAEDRARAEALLARVGCAGMASRTFSTLSSGERQRCLLARALMGEPGLLLLDEPNAGLDLGGREELVATLSDLAADPSTPPWILVTHHVEEIPPGSTHVLMLRAGAVVSCGPIAECLTEQDLSACFGVEVRLERHGDRYAARADA